MANDTVLKKGNEKCRYPSK